MANSKYNKVPNYVITSASLLGPNFLLGTLYSSTLKSYGHSDIVFINIIEFYWSATIDKYF
jgi:hypothetical protein